MNTSVKANFFRLTYIYHDGFLLETDEAFILFDLWRFPESQSFLMDEISAAGKPLYVLVSHHHKDHFDRSIFDWQKLFPPGHIHYILSKDTARSVRYMLGDKGLYKGQRVAEENFSILAPGDVFSDAIITVRAFGSTDTGNSYLLETGGKKIFHAGDLNAWIWKDESTDKEVARAISDFESIVKGIARMAPRLDLAMFPVDSRLGTDYWEGASRFVRMIDVDRFVPMHFELAENDSERAQRRKDALAFRLYRHPVRGEYIGLSAPGDTLEFI
ncbi:MAG: MBL fold metallo-hydrolase [Bacteroidales bacterium]|nr:MBL fold metallo-hydrolase [Bacteroidales bacterium]